MSILGPKMRRGLGKAYPPLPLLRSAPSTPAAADWRLACRRADAAAEVCSMQVWQVGTGTRMHSQQQWQWQVATSGAAQTNMHMTTAVQLYGRAAYQ